MGVNRGKQFLVAEATHSEGCSCELSAASALSSWGSGESGEALGTPTCALQVHSVHPTENKKRAGLRKHGRSKDHALAMMTSLSYLSRTIRHILLDLGQVIQPFCI